ncbi:glutamate--cysteine ligase, putative [Trichodesmium erythraeum IMS101]|uniref:Glutamate--cysteine ligase, putative n=1 Tax=Trichodesmium erythraeum (strain IMS101) TaxID=203124 RepID=Q119U6_TRIEI|nr:glutamate--cysteine ligase [Trichodesmium erythraeum GBRTRLIN201]MDE5093773.1 glutamate--cysteine ligase [Trichodesmium sp. St11_bin5]
MLLSKGLELEIYTGTSQGNIVGLSEQIVEKLEGFAREPDSRIVEYTTAPLCSYDRLLCALVKPRRELRKYLTTLGDYTIIPGSTLSLGNSNLFYPSDPNNPYYKYIEKTYSTKIVTTSIHINIGISDPELLMQAIRLIRMEAPLYLALSASSPFLDTQVTGFHSTRWATFPKTPTDVPLFESHSHFIKWTEEQIAAGLMQNVRHLWSSVRPNGDRRPYNLNRLELRICDFVDNPVIQLALVAFLEARLWQLFDQPHLDPLEKSNFPGTKSSQDLVALANHNETAVAHNSLEAKLCHWQDGRNILARQWIEEIYQQVLPYAKNRGFSCFLSPIKKILREGNTAQKLLRQYQSSLDIQSVIKTATLEMAQQEEELEEKLCQSMVA